MCHLQCCVVALVAKRAHFRSMPRPAHVPRSAPSSKSPSTDTLRRESGSNRRRRPTREVARRHPCSQHRFSRNAARWRNPATTIIWEPLQAPDVSRETATLLANVPFRAYRAGRKFRRIAFSIGESTGRFGPRHRRRWGSHAPARPANVSRETQTLSKDGRWHSRNVRPQESAWPIMGRNAATGPLPTPV